MNGTTTTTGVTGVFLTAALAVSPLMGFERVNLTPYELSPACTSVETRREFEGGYRMVDDKIVRNGLVDEIRVVNSLLEIGRVLFKDARSETPEDMRARRAYFKSRYSKA